MSATTPGLVGRLSHACAPGRGREDDRVDLAGGHAADRRRRPQPGPGRAPAVDDEARDLGAGRREHLVQPVGARAVVLDGDARPATPSLSSTSATSARVSDSATQSAVQPGGLDRAAGLGAARDDPGALEHAARAARRARARRPPRSSRGTRCRWSPPRCPAGRPSSDAGALEQPSSSTCGTMLSAGACRTSAPRRPSAAASSADRRSAVMSTTRPARIWSMGSSRGHCDGPGGRSVRRPAV